MEQTYNQYYKMIYCKTNPAVKIFPAGELEECIDAAKKFAACGYTVSCYLVMDGVTSIDPFLQLPKPEEEEPTPYIPFSAAELFADAK